MRIVHDTDVASASIKQNLPTVARRDLVYDLPLATLNVSDFDHLAEPEGLRLITA